jgi:hypothetical protein
LLTPKLLIRLLHRQCPCSGIVYSMHLCQVRQKCNLSCSSISFPCPIPCGGYPASSCLQSSEQLEQEVAVCLVLALVG